MLLRIFLLCFALSKSTVWTKYIQSNNNLRIFRVVGGKNASPKQIPYQVSIEYQNEHKCGGTIISKYHILTAAHCTDDKVTDLLYIRAGSVIRKRGGQLIRVKDVYQHPLFNDTTYDYDVSILVLQIPLTFNSYVKPAKLPNENEPVTAKTGTASGWGQIGEEEWVLPTTLQFVELPIWTQKECKEFDSDITDRMLCAGFLKGGKDTCLADSGGPLASRGKLIAVISWGYGCAKPNKLGVLIKVASVRRWIKNKIQI